MADKPSGSSDTLFFLGLITIFGLMIFGKTVGIDVGGSSGGRATTPTKVNSSIEKGFVDSNGNTIPNENISPWKGKVAIEKGTASSEYQTYKEYIVLRTSGLKKNETVNITGWSLTNGKGARLYQINDTQIKGTTDRVVIPQASRVFLTTGKNYPGPIVLGPSSRVYLNTGNVPNKLPFEVTSFQVNKCSGYIATTENYKFYPSLSRSCPDPEKEIDLDTLDENCYKFVRSLATCHTPEFKERTKVGDHYEYGYVDGVGNLSNQCKVILKNYFNYNSCVAIHGTDPDFLKNEWRVFLNRPWELWAKTRETITLYDNMGRFVDDLSY